MQIIDGKKISQEIKDEVKEEVAQLKAEGKDIALAVIQVGADPASSVYVRNKKRACEYVGIESVSYELPEETTQEELMAIVDKCNKDPKINGILVQLPLPKHLDEDEVLLAIDPKKDVDGFHPVSVGNMVIGEKGFLPCTPAGVIQLLKRSGVEIDGKEYFLVDTLKDNKNTYNYFANTLDKEDIYVLKDKKEVFDEYYVPLDNENEVLYAMSMFYDKYAS